jgi:hypothetical protein
MRRDITWIEKLPDRVRREVRVHFHGGKIFWKDKHSVGRRDEESFWNEAMQPTDEDWERLREEVLRRHQRGMASQDELDLIEKRAIGVKRGAPSQRISKQL